MTPGLMSSIRPRKRLSRVFPDGRAEDARKAIDAADRAQPQWEALPAIERANWLRKISAGIRQRADEISALIVAEGGKIPQLADVEVAFTADYIDYMAEWARRYEGEICKAIARVRISCCLSVHWA
jgi:lactaldehyde dehydrogenase/glycolaldehyde dehydrogenase